MDIRDKQQCTPLITAAQYDDVPLLCAAPARHLHHCSCSHRVGAQHMAPNCLAVGCSWLLLRHGADINAIDLNGDSALHWAAYKGSAGCGILVHPPRGPGGVTRCNSMELIYPITQQRQPTPNTASQCNLARSHASFRLGGATHTAAAMASFGLLKRLRHW